MDEGESKYSSMPKYKKMRREGEKRKMKEK
jgi:hypothetical protein